MTLRPMTRFLSVYHTLYENWIAQNTVARPPSRLGLRQALSFGGQEVLTTAANPDG